MPLLGRFGVDCVCAFITQFLCDIQQVTQHLQVAAVVTNCQLIQYYLGHPLSGGIRASSVRVLCLYCSSGSPCGSGTCCPWGWKGKPVTPSSTQVDPCSSVSLLIHLPSAKWGWHNPSTSLGGWEQVYSHLGSSQTQERSSRRRSPKRNEKYVFRGHVLNTSPSSISSTWLCNLNTLHWI